MKVMPVYFMWIVKQKSYNSTDLMQVRILFIIVTSDCYLFTYSFNMFLFFW